MLGNGMAVHVGGRNNKLATDTLTSPLSSGWIAGVCRDSELSAAECIYTNKHYSPVKQATHRNNNTTICRARTISPGHRKQQRNYPSTRRSEKKAPLQRVAISSEVDLLPRSL